jgi:hypothetical protein
VFVFWSVQGIYINNPMTKKREKKLKRYRRKKEIVLAAENRK